MADFTAANAGSLANFQSGSATFGHLTVKWNIDTSIPRVTVDATLSGIPIGHAVLDRQHPTAHLGGNIGVAEAEIDLTADFDKKEIDYKVLVKAFGITIINKSGKLIGW